MINFPTSPADGDVHVDSSGATWMWEAASSAWIPTAGKVSTGEWIYTATTNQTTFAAGYTPGFVDVFVNGLRKTSTDFTATDGATVVLNTGLNAGDVVHILTPMPAMVLDTYPQAIVDDLADVAGYGLKGYQIYTSGSGTYTVPVGVRAIYVELTGGGGGSGGVDGQGAGTAAASAGGNGGAFCARFITDLAASYSYAVGAGGNAGTPTADGGDGGNTTFSGGVVSMVAGGGLGSLYKVASNGAVSISTYDVATASGGELNLSGGNADMCKADGDYMRTTAGAGRAAGPYGGGSLYPDATGAGTSGRKYGAGGGGALANGGISTNYNGATGGPGLIVITEYY